VCLLLGARADANLKNSYLDTAMHAASTAGHSHVVEALVKGGGDVNAESEDGETSLHCAAYAGQARSCKVLVSLGAGEMTVHWPHSRGRGRPRAHNVA